MTWVKSSLCQSSPTHPSDLSENDQNAVPHTVPKPEIHIQAFVDFINAIVIIFKSSSSQNINQNEVLKTKRQDFHKISQKRNVLVPDLQR